ncbi:MAG: hypothetical protein ACFB0B_10535 [Thermonemataceae bacterium]
MKSLVSIMAAALILAGCQQSSDESFETIQTSIETPFQEGEVYYDEQIPIRGLVEDPVEVHTYTLEIKMMPKDSSVFFVYVHQHERQLPIDTSWHNLIDFDTDLRLYFTAYNHNNQVDSTVIDFKSKMRRP